MTPGFGPRGALDGQKTRNKPLFVTISSQVSLKMNLSGAIVHAQKYLLVQHEDAIHHYFLSVLTMYTLLRTKPVSIFVRRSAGKTKRKKKIERTAKPLAVLVYAP